jgi:hypothetical protein
MALHPDMSGFLAMATFGTPANNLAVPFRFIKALWRDTFASLGRCIVASVTREHSYMLWCTGPSTMQLLSLQAVDNVIEVQRGVAVNEGLAERVIVVREGSE